MNTKVSVLICTRDRPDTVGQAIESVVRCAYPSFDVHVMDLNPNTWHVDRVHVRRKAAVRVEDVLADVARTGDHVGTILSRFLQKTLPEIAVVDFGELL